MVFFVFCHLHQICKLSLWQIKRVITSLIFYMLGLSKITKSKKKKNVLQLTEKFVKSYNYCYFFQILYGRDKTEEIKPMSTKDKG